MKRKCLNILCKICGRHALLPSPFQIPLCFDRSKDRARYRGGYADVWMGKHQGCEVAVKVLRVYSASDLNKIISVSHHSSFAKSAHRNDRCDRCDRADVLQRSCNMEGPPPSKRAPAVGGDDGGKALCNGLRMDGQWEHQRIHQGI